MKYRAKPRTVNAIRFDGTNHVEVAEWCITLGIFGTPITSRQEVAVRAVTSGVWGAVSLAGAGDWVVFAPRGVTVLTDAEFADMYEPEPDAPPVRPQTDAPTVVRRRGRPRKDGKQ